MTPENLLSEWARLLVESLADAGLRHVIVSPGSRSTPLVCAALACSRLELRSVLDERDAAFYAVGHARITGAPVALVCTSGSAVANYFPAIVEASLSRTPLLVVTADRPFELQDCGAPQTLDQIGIFGKFARFVELGMPESEPAALDAVRRRAAQAVFDARFPEGGPVHLNVRARKPLEPVPARSEAGHALSRGVDARLGTPITSVRAPKQVPRDEDVALLARALRGARRGLVVCGPCPSSGSPLGPALAAVARGAHFPVYAEATSQLRFDAPEDLPEGLRLDLLDVLCRSRTFVERLAPDVVLQVGNAPTSSSWERAVAASPGLALHAVAPWGFPDPGHRARTIVLCDLAETLARLAAALGDGAPTGEQRSFAEELARANGAARRALDAASAAAGFPSEGRATRAVVSAMPSGSLLAVGNSLPVRHLDVFCPARASGITVVHQRGASGIDGVVAAAAGSASASGRPTVLLVGDVSALHDVGGFAVAAGAKSPLVVVVLNNDGGRIFEQLPLRGAGLDEERLRLWTTPHGRTFDAVARLHELPYSRVDTERALVDAVTRGLSHAGCTVIEVPCPPHGAEREYAALAAQVEGALTAP